MELARTLVVGEMRAIQRAQGCKPRRAAHLLLDRARAGQLRPATLAKLQQACDKRGRYAAEHDGLPSTVSLQRWARKATAGHSLAPRNSAETSFAVRPWHRAFFALTDRPQKPSLRQAYDQLLAHWQPEWADTPGGPPPSYFVVCREYAKRSKIDRLKGRHTGSALRSRTFFHKRTYHGLEPFTEVHSDGWNTHFTAPHPVTGQFVTYELWHFHDVATRYVTPIAVGLTENTDVILQGLQNCIRVGGVMAIWQTDHSSSVKNQRVMDEHAGLADRLGISVVHPAQVGNSQANGIAENFNTWLDRQARELATYQHPQRMDSGTFVRVRRITNAMVKAADKPAERAALRQKAMRMGKGIVFDTHAEALAWIAALERRWNDHAHRELPRVQDAAGRWTHLTPQQSLDAAIAAGWKPLKLPEPVLVDQFRPHLRKKITRGTVTPFNGQRYHHADLAHHEGEEVLVAVDRDDPSQVWVKDLQGRLIAVAGFVEAVKSRTESMAEHSQRKRAEAQIRLREQQIEQIEERIAPPALEMPAAPVFEIPAVLTQPRARDDDDERPRSFFESELRRIERFGFGPPRRDDEPRQLSYAETMEHLLMKERERAELAAQAGQGRAQDKEDGGGDEEPLKRVAAG